MSNQPTNGVQSQLPTESGIGDFTDVELMNVTGGGLIRSAGHAIVDRAKLIADVNKGVAKAVASRTRDARDVVVSGAKGVGSGISTGVQNAWKWLY